VLRTAFCALMLCAPPMAAAQSDPRIIYASVVDKSGAPVLGLGPNNFIVREDAIAREILSVVPDRDPMQIALLVDDSAQMRGGEMSLRKSVAAFIRAMRPDVMIALIGLGERPTIRADYTRDKELLLKAVDNLWGHGTNTLSDAIFETSTALAKRPLMRPVIVAVTAGGGGFRHRIEVLDQLALSQAAVHVITISEQGGISGRLVHEATEKTGGRDDVLVGVTNLERKLVQVATELSNQYRVTFARPQRLIPPTKTEIEARNPAFHARGMLLLTDEERRK
jgi:VWA domain-containing protein